MTRPRTELIVMQIVIPPFLSTKLPIDGRIVAAVKWITPNKEPARTSLMPYLIISIYETKKNVGNRAAYYDVIAQVRSQNDFGYPKISLIFPKQEYFSGLTSVTTLPPVCPASTETTSSYLIWVSESSIGPV